MKLKIYIMLAMFCISGASFASIPVRDKIAQMLIVGFNNQVLDDNNPIYHAIQNEKIGGVILFNKNMDKMHNYEKNIKNPPQLKKLISDLQQISSTPLFISIDQEGGKVSRLDRGFNVSTLSAHDLGEINNLDYTYNQAIKTAKTLQELGININFAPCIDVNINPKSPIAAQHRIFSDNAETVALHANQVIKAHNQHHILPVIKHFPGHGSVVQDTHHGFADATDSFNESELYPYQYLIKQNPLLGVMSTHVFNANIDEKYPATLSQKTITDLLKHKLAFTGLVFSDDLNMGALTNNYTWEEILINTINAGVDILIIGNNLSFNPNITTTTINTIESAIKSGKIPQSRIDESYNKIIQVKKQLD